MNTPYTLSLMDEKYGQPEVKSALLTLNQMPGLNATFYSGSSSLGEICSFDITPVCRFSTKREAEDFGKKLYQLCSTNFQKIGKMIAVKGYGPIDIQRFGEYKYGVEFKVTVTDNADKLDFLSRMRLRKTVNHIIKNAKDITALLSQHGVDTSDFKGFSKEKFD